VHAESTDAMTEQRREARDAGARRSDRPGLLLWLIDVGQVAGTKPDGVSRLDRSEQRVHAHAGCSISDASRATENSTSAARKNIGLL